MVDMFDKINGAKPTQGGNYFQPGFEGIVMVNRFTEGVTRKSVQFTVAEVRILVSNSDVDKPGDERSWWVGWDKEGAANNVMQFLTAATGSPAEEITKDVLKTLLSAAQPLSKWQNGHPLMLRLKTYQKPGKTYTNHKWSALDTKDLALAEATAKEMGYI